MSAGTRASFSFDGRTRSVTKSWTRRRRASGNASACPPTSSRCSRTRANAARDPEAASHPELLFPAEDGGLHPEHCSARRSSGGAHRSRDELHPTRATPHVQRPRTRGEGGGARHEEHLRASHRADARALLDGPPRRAAREHWRGTASREGRARYARRSAWWYSRWYSRPREWYFEARSRMKPLLEPAFFSSFLCRRERFRTSDPYRVKVNVSVSHRYE